MSIEWILFWIIVGSILIALIILFRIMYLDLNAKQRKRTKELPKYENPPEPPPLIKPKKIERFKMFRHGIYHVINRMYYEPMEGDYVSEFEDRFTDPELAKAHLSALRKQYGRYIDPVTKR